MAAAPPPSRAAADVIGAGDAVVGIELGSTRIKAALVGPDGTPLASAAEAWESHRVDGIWTYGLPAVWDGLAACYAGLAREVRHRHGVDIQALGALGISAMMHGYLAFDAAGRLLVPFRTWRNNITAPACAELTPVLDFAVPQRWTIAHLHQSILEEQPHVREIARLTTLAGYVHWQLTGEHVVGIGEASGMFPIDPGTGDWDARRLAAFDELVRPRELGWTLRELLPAVLPAGRAAGTLTAEGARRLDPTGRLHGGVTLCPPEGDAGTGMVATNAVRPRTGNVSAGTSVFAMIVLERPLAQIHDGIDIVATPDGRPVAMAHSNNGSSDLDAWLAVLEDAATALGADTADDDVHGKLLGLAATADPDAGGLLAINYVSGEHATGFSEGRPLFVRMAGSRFTLPNFVRALLFASLCGMRAGLDILTDEEGVALDLIRGHGGFFKSGETAWRVMAAALGVPISVPAGAGEGGAWGMALLAAYLLRSDPRVGLADFLEARIGGSSAPAIEPDPDEMAGFAAFYARQRRGLVIERAALQALPGDWQPAGARARAG